MTDLSYQLYSSRNFPPLDDTLGRLRQMGYRRVEGYGGLFEDDAAVTALAGSLARHELTMPSAHVGLDMIEGDPARVIEIAQTLGIREVYAPFLPPEARPADAEGWRAFGARLHESAQPLKTAGLIVGWHNHDFEFTALPTGELPIDMMLDGHDLAFEFDVAWAVVAGVDPVPVIQRWGPQITAAHVKDRAAPGQNTDEDGWADLGEGTLDWPTFHAALVTAGCTNFVAEHDNPSDDTRFADGAMRYFQTLN